jgi:hypothetical protein
MAAAAISLGLGAASFIASLFGAKNSADAAERAAGLQAEAAGYAADRQYQTAAEANALTQLMYQQGRADLAPWRSTGAGALYKLSDLMGITPLQQTGGAAPATGLPAGATAGTTPGAASATPLTIDEFWARAGRAEPNATYAQAKLNAEQNPDNQDAQAFLAILDQDRNRGYQAYLSELAATPSTGTPGTPGGAGTGVPPTGGEYPAFTPSSEFGSLANEAPFQFGAAEFQSDPGYAFRVQEGTKALERSAAAKGGLLSGGTGKALERYGQGLATQEYGDAFNRAFTTYNAKRAVNTDLFNRLSLMAGTGQQATNSLVNYGQQAAQDTNAANINATKTASQYSTDAAAARASGYVGGANAWNQGISTGLGGVANAISLYGLLNNWGK